ncbi:hypothetical protein TPHA_0B00250 [Tetrapisispora phaffii CBS 4417]|uniref:alpha-1,2-Mannosidase n=1 Tax=Tetrapisispora phaffii (strain ATCC 24235 / CBS 4417 / NBRC 1672 / NRRL Y-8282 / UCD 70-5) TaxID=1071381 RepID=G8BQA0_TETPH|nr:hypothetical protein TPHA_0B00250 [Tetrapisispora phaffii CBS 4417]CCE61697.1 hypothetical protein TPHA_0B00250 [Tetrapisispora phaffii CBS 4417]
MVWYYTELYLVLIYFISLLDIATASDHSRGQDFAPYHFTDKELIYYRNEVKSLFYESLDNYLEIAYPFDELLPISCVAKKRNFDDPGDIITNDVLGNFTTTLIDALTTVAVFNDRDKFKELVNLVKETFPNGFAIDSTIQVFETTIRILGSLISAHLYATDPSKKVFLGDDYDGCLLDLAIDLGDRLLPAFLTNTGLPVPRINLLTGLNGLTMDLVQENNVAALGCPMFEFTMLSVLTNDAKYEIMTRYAFDKVWSLRSDLDLLPMSLNPQTLAVYTQISGIGASIDSIYEYALKGAILFDDQDLYEVWHDSYTALNINSKQDWLYANVHQYTSMLATPWIDSLSAFFPGLQVLNGDIEAATYQNLMSLKLWDTYGGIPERWNFQPDCPLQGLNNSELVDKVLPLEWYPLRPEFIESTYYLFRATNDPFYLNTGAHILKDLKTRFKQKCGLAGIQDIRTGEPQDRMESFVLSETLKYLFLLFDDKNEIHKTRDNIIFSTEAQPMWISTELKHRYSRNRYFNETIYVDHIRYVVDEDKRKLEKELKNSKNSKQFDLVKGIKRIYNEEAMSPAMQQIHDRFKYQISEYYKPGMCVISNFTQHKDRYQNKVMLSSNLLNNFSKLFEIENIYNETLIKPDYLKYYDQMEINDQFYKIWSSGKAISTPSSSTFSMDIVIDLPGKLRWNMLGNGDIQLDTMYGRRKIRLEKIYPNDLDTYGNYAEETVFSRLDRNDIRSERCIEVGNNTSVPYIYRATRINGIFLSESNNIYINKKAFISDEAHEGGAKFNLFDNFGLNKDHHLLLECIPIVNIFLE